MSRTAGREARRYLLELEEVRRALTPAETPQAVYEEFDVVLGGLALIAARLDPKGNPHP